MRPAHKCISIRKTRTVDLRWVNISRVISGVSEPKFINFCSTRKRLRLITPFTACRYLYPVQRYLQSNLKVVVKSTKFWTFFALPNFKGAKPPPKLYARYHHDLAARQMAKFHEAVPFDSKVLATNTHFKPILNPLRKKL